MLSLIPFTLLIASAVASPTGTARHSNISKRQYRNPYGPDLKSIGCYSYPEMLADGGSNHRSFLYDFEGDRVEYCGSICSDPSTVDSPDSPFPYAYLSGDECLCYDAVIPQAKLPDSDCTLPCSGDGDELCGGVDATDQYYSGYQFYDASYTPSWHSLGCHEDQIPGILPEYKLNLFNNSVESCQATCAAGNYTFAGLESGVLCACGNAISSNKTTPAGDCFVGCPGNNTEKCGGLAFRMSLYEFY